MSNSASIIPPGSPLQRTRTNRYSKLFVTVFAVLAVHVLLLAGLLIQGCKRQDKTGAINPSEEGPQTAAAPVPSSEAPPKAAVPPNIPPTNVSLPSPAASATRLEPGVPVQPPFESIVVTNAAPPPAPSVPQPLVQLNAPTTPPPASVEGDTPTTIYSVKQGDTLTKIALAHGTTVRALRAVNALKTDRIVVGQKLKVPQAKPGGTDTAK
jgi:LysM repeat protein